MANEIVQAIEAIGTGFDEFKKINDQRIEEERKGNEARARELSGKLDRIETELVTESKKKRELEQRLAMQQDRIEILEALNDRPRGTIQEKLRNEHNDLFNQWIRSGGQDRDAEKKFKELQTKAMEVKDVTIGTTTAGGFALPEEISAQIEKLILRQSEIVSNVKNVRVGTSDYKELVSIFGGNSGWVGETGSRSATGTPNLRERAPTWGELYSYPQVSEWSLQDIFFSVEQWLVNDIADGMAINLSTAIWNGNGSSKPTGMTNTSTVTTADTASPLRAAAAYQHTTLVGFSPSSPSQINMDAIINLVYTLAPGYRAGAKFAANTITQGIMRRMKTSQGVYLWEPSLQVGQPDRLLGYPVFTWEDMGNGNVADATALAFGDFQKGYVLASRAELAVTRENFTTPGYVKFYVRRRYGGCPLNNDAIKFLKVTD